MNSGREVHFKNRAICDLIIILMTTGVISVICGFIYKHYHPSSDYNSSINENFMDQIPRYFFAPEPVEKLQFMISLFLLPILIIVFIFLVNYLIKSNHTVFNLLNSNYMIEISNIIILSLFLLFLFFIANNKNTPDFYFKHNYFILSPIKSIIMTLILLPLFLYASLHNNILKRIMLSLLQVFCLAISLFLAIMNVFSIQTVQNEGIYLSHLNAVYHSVAAVIANQYILIDFPTQYGLYAHLLEPLFRITGLNLSIFTSVMAVLIFGTFYFWAYFLKKSLENTILSFIGFLMTIYIGYIFVRLDNIDSYFQYYPIRTIFPALLLFLSVRYFKRETKKLYYVSFFLYAIGVLWNFETGIIVYISWIAVLIFNELSLEISKVAFKNCLLHTLKGIIILILVFTMYSLYILLRSGTLPNFIKMFQYIRYFYDYGFFMIPMPIIHPWNLVILSYIIGLVISIRSIIDKNTIFKSKMIFLVSILGLGLFSYYQGRSHDIVLLYVTYPCLMLFTLFTDNILENIKHNRKFRSQTVAFSLFFVFMLTTVFSTIYNFGTLFNYLKYHWTAMINNENNYITMGTDYIKQFTHAGEEVLILSMNSGIYYADTKVKPVLDLPGSSEMFLKEDYKVIMDTIKTKKLNQIFYDSNYTANDTANVSANEEVLKSLLENYKVFGSSLDQNMIRLVPYENINKEVTVRLSNPSIAHYALMENKLFLKDVINEGILSQKSSLPIVSLPFNFSLELIVYPGVNQEKHAIIAGNHPGKSSYDGFVIQQDEDKQNQFYFAFGNGKSWTKSDNFIIVPNKLNYIAVTLNEKMMTIYLNGDKIQESEVDSNMFNSELPLMIGNWIYGNRPFNGEVREINLSNNIISSEDVINTWSEINN